MPGAGKKRKAREQNDKKNPAPPQQSAVPSTGTQTTNPGQTLLQVDGPGSNPSGPPRPSSTRPPSTRPPSTGAPSTGAPATATAPPTRPRNVTKDFLFNRNIDYGGSAYKIKEDMPVDLMKRPGWSKSGTAAQITLNSYQVTNYPGETIAQYDIWVDDGLQMRGVNKAVWGSKTMAEWRRKYAPSFIYDGARIGYATNVIKPEQQKIDVDLDAEKGFADTGPKKNKKRDSHYVIIRYSAVVHTGVLREYLAGKTDFSRNVLEAINFLDHVLRETPTKHSIAIKRSFYGRFLDREIIGGTKKFGKGLCAVEAMKGLYQSIRCAQGGKLIVNVDISNTAFWREDYNLMQVCQALTGLGEDVQFKGAMKDVQVRYRGKWYESPVSKDLHKLRKFQFHVIHDGRSKAESEKIYRIEKVSEKNARDEVFLWKHDGTEENINIEKYYKRRYDYTLEWPLMPLVQTTKKKVLFPMELCYMAYAQRYPFKLNPIETSDMIKFAVTRPQKRMEDIQKGLRHMIKWAEDPVLNTYGIKMDSNLMKTNARVLEPPKVLFSEEKKQSQTPGYKGRWRIDGMRFNVVNPQPLQSWGFCVVKRPELGDKINVSQPALQSFITSFVNIYRSHGGQVTNERPAITLAGPDLATSVIECFNAAGNQARLRPQILFFICHVKDPDEYNRIKKSCDCRFGVMSQVLQGNKVYDNNPQYHSNVCMKVNAKLGGATARVPSPRDAKWGSFKEPTMIMGADVSHAAPGSWQPSMAAITCSIDQHAMRYMAACETNGHREEMILTINIENMAHPLISEWTTTIGKGKDPSHIIYFRDGVSEGQYQNVLYKEVADFKNYFANLHELKLKNYTFPKFTVIVVEKRHHIRFFPTPNTKAADRNGNPVPGVLVERDVTHPFENDFYLCSHNALQGTARPTHYHVLMDEANMTPDELHRLCYEHVYQYMRSTTPVSMHPAVYYAHLASNRARSHENISSDERQKREKDPYGDQSKPSDGPVSKLIAMEEIGRIHKGMWYI